MKNRIDQLDYLKCIFILLMVIFHLVYIGDKYPYIKQIVYTFHMSAFLIISGYLANIKGNSRQFALSTLWIFIPYAIMEIGYVLMSSILPVREGVKEISLSLIFEKVLIDPIGPYWYLHTLIICYITYYVVNKVCSNMNKLSFIIILATCFWGLSKGFNLLSLDNALYFTIGVIVYQSKQQFLSIFRPSAWSIIPLVILCLYPENLNRSSLAGVIITYLSISLSLYTYNYLPLKGKQIAQFIGCNTLPILLFSPIFTITAKVLIPLFSFDPTGLCFMSVATLFVIVGSLTVAWAMDKTKISRWFCGKENLIHSSTIASR